MNDNFRRKVIQATGLCKHIEGPEGRLDILDDISFEARVSDAVAILGPSGAGKSTLLGLLAGLDIPSSGELSLLGEDLVTMSEDERAGLRAGRVGFVFQSFQLLAGLNAMENVAIALELGGEPKDSRVRAKDSLERVGLGRRLKHFPHQLSGGEQQRVAIARAFATQPEVLFADEPTGNLDQHTGNSVIELLFAMRDEYDTTLILVTHDDALTGYCNLRYRLESGRMQSA